MSGSAPARTSTGTAVDVVASEGVAFEGVGFAGVAPEGADAPLATTLGRALAGEVPAFSEFYRRTSPQVYCVVLRVLRCPDLAAEVTQEVYVDVWRRSARYDPARGPVRPWLLTVAHRRAVDRVRAVSSSRARDLRYAAVSGSRDVDDVWEQVSVRSDGTYVRAALARVSVLQREAISLAYFDGHTHSQIAAILEVPLGTVKTRIRDGLTALRRNLAPLPRSTDPAGVGWSTTPG